MQQIIANVAAENESSDWSFTQTAARLPNTSHSRQLKKARWVNWVARLRREHPAHKPACRQSTFVGKAPKNVIWQQSDNSRLDAEPPLPLTSAL